MKRSFRVLATLCLILFGLMSLATPIPRQAQAAAPSSPSAFVSAQWRVVVYQTAASDSFDAFGLKAEAGKKWAVLLADVTNLGATGPIDLTSFGVSTGTEGSGNFASDATLAVAKKLGLESSTTVQMNENSSVRVALAFDVPVNGKVNSLKSWYLALQGQKLPLASTASTSIDAASLPKLVPTMQLEATTIQSIDGNGSLTVTSQSGGAHPVTISGVTTPPKDGCYGADSAQAVMDLTGGQVWLEKDGSAYLVWANDGQQGTFVLLNQRLIEFGAAGYKSGNSSYSPWLKSLASLAQQKKVGLRQQCRDARGTYINPPTPTAAEVRAQYQQVDVRDLSIRTNNFIGKKVTVAGTVFNIQADTSGTFMQIWVDAPDGTQVPVIIGYKGDSSGIYEGTYVTVYGTCIGRISGTNRLGGPIEQPAISADIVDH